MTALSRRQLARYAAAELIKGRSAAKLSRSLAAVLVAGKKTHEADLLVSDIAHELEVQGHLAWTTVTSAERLPAALKRQLTARVKTAAKVKQVIINEEVDADVIGGVKVETAVHSWDETLTGRLAEIKGGLNG